MHNKLLLEDIIRRHTSRLGCSSALASGAGYARTALVRVLLPPSPWALLAALPLQSAKSKFNAWVSLNTWEEQINTVRYHLECKAIQLHIHYNIECGSPNLYLSLGLVGERSVVP